MDPTDRRAERPPDAQADADYAPTTEFKAFVAGEPVPTGDQGRRQPESGGFLARLRSLFQGSQR
jgi:hypothetical protein